MRYLFALTMVAAMTLAAQADVVPARIELSAAETNVPALLFRPSGSGPFPAIVAMHGCGGLIDRAGKERREYIEWAEYLVAAGFAVLFPDSYTPRGLGPQCTVQRRRVRPDRERQADAITARTWLQEQDWVQSDRVALLGWSNGAVATLWAVRPRAVPKDGKPDFRSAIAFYPGCRRLTETAWSSRIPTLIMIGALDNWARARDCEQMVAQARGRSAHTTIVTYAGTFHYFDRANLPVQERTGQAFTPDGSGRVHVGTNDAARADALKRVPEWLAR